MSTRSVLLCLALLLCFVAGHITATAWPWEKKSPDRQPAEAAPDAAADAQRPDTLRLMGRLVPQGGIVDVGATPGDRLVRLNVRLNDPVQPTDSLEPADHLGELESYELRKLEFEAADSRYRQAESRRTAELESAKAQLAAAQEAVSQAEAIDPQVAYQQRQVALAEHNLKLAQADLDRLEQLRNDLVSQPEKDRQALVVEKAELELFATRSALERSTQAAQFQLATANAQLTVAQTALDRADSMTVLSPFQAERKLAERRLREGLLVAPSAGRVIAILTREGQTVKTGPILQIADTSNMACVAEVHESDIHSVQTGQQVEITSPAFAGTVHGVVESIGLQAGSPQLRSLDPLAPQNRHAIEVRIKLDPENSAIVSNLTDLQVDVAIEVESQQASPPETGGSGDGREDP